MISFQRVISPLRAIFGGSKHREAGLKRLSPRSFPTGVILEKQFPRGFSVYGICQGPAGSGQILIGAGNPATSRGSIFLGSKGSVWTESELPEDVAYVSKFLRLKDGRYLAGGMNSIGRGALLVSDPDAKNWEVLDLDLHPYSAIANVFRCEDDSIVFSVGKMLTQGKTKPVLFRSRDEGETWEKEDVDLPITVFMSSKTSSDGHLLLGTAGDQDPLMYISKDSAKTFESLPPFPAYKTYKTIHQEIVEIEGQKRLLVVLWGYKIAEADRIVRIYLSTESGTDWEELPPVDDSHFIFSFLQTSKKEFFVGSEKGRIYRSTDYGLSWNEVTSFSTNIGAYALFEDESQNIWVGKDFVEPDDYSLWRIDRSALKG